MDTTTKSPEQPKTSSEAVAAQGKTELVFKNPQQRVLYLISRELGNRGAGGEPATAADKNYDLSRGGGQGFVFLSNILSFL